MELSDRCTAVASRHRSAHELHAPVRPRRALRLARVRGTRRRRQYDVELPPPLDRTVTTPALAASSATGVAARASTARTVRCVSPPPFTEAPWRGGFMKWADATFPPEEAEAAIVLRRSCDIGMGRGMDLEAIPVALDLAGIMTGICYSMQPEVMPVAFRNKGSIRDFGRHPDDRRCPAG